MLALDTIVLLLFVFAVRAPCVRTGCTAARACAEEIGSAADIINGLLYGLLTTPNGLRGMPWDGDEASETDDEVHTF